MVHHRLSANFGIVVAHAVLAQARLVVPLLSIPNHMLLNAEGPATLCPSPSGCRCLLALQIYWRLSTQID